LERNGTRSGHNRYWSYASPSKANSNILINTNSTSFHQKGSETSFIRNDTRELAGILKPDPTMHRKQRYITTNSVQYRDLGAKQRSENLQLEKDDIRFTRRIIETHNRKSIEHAANVTKSLAVKKEALARL